MARIQVVGTRKQPGRCAYCRDGLDALVHRCEGCGTWLHLDCLEELGGRCPTPGCTGQTPVGDPQPPRRRDRAPRPRGRAGRERRRQHRERRRDPSARTLQDWATEEAVDHHRRPSGWARFGPYSRLVLSGLFNLVMVSAIAFAFGYALLHPAATWDGLKHGKHGESVVNGVLYLLALGGFGGLWLWVGLRWLVRWPSVWDEVGQLLDHGRPVPARLRVWTTGSGKHRHTLAELSPVEGLGRRATFKLEGLLPPGWLRRSRAGTPVLVYGLEDGEPPYLIESGNGQLALVHPD